MRATDVLRGEIAATDPVMQFLAPGEVSLQVTAIQRVLAPGRISEAAVIRCWLQGRFAEDHVAEFDAQVCDVLDAVDRLFESLTQNHPGSAQ